MPAAHLTAPEGSGEVQEVPPYSARSAPGGVAPWRPSGKLGTAEVAYGELCLLIRLFVRLRVRSPAHTLLSVAAVAAVSLLIAFTWFQIPEVAPLYYRVITLHSLMFTAFSNLGSFTSLSRDRLDLLQPPRMALASDGRASKQALPYSRRLFGAKVNTPPILCGQYFAPASVWFARSIVDLPIKWANATLSTAIIYPIVGLRGGDGRFVFYLIALLLQGPTNGALGLLSSALSEDPFSGLQAGLAIFLFNYIFGGSTYSITRVTWILRWLRYLCISFYINQMLLNTQFDTGFSVDGELPSSSILFSDSHLIMPYWAALLGGLALFILYHIIGPLVLAYSISGPPRRRRK